MKLFTSLVLGLLIACSSPLFSQKKRKHAHNQHKKAHKKQVQRAVYKRNQVVSLQKRKVKRINTLPAGHKVIVFKKSNYYFHKGYYYNKVGSNYVIIPSPRGLKVNVLPIGYRTIKIRGINHFYYRGTLYRQSGKTYEVIEPETGVIVDELPEYNVDQVTINNNTYYEYDNILYKKITSGTNYGKYEVIGSLED